MSKNDYFNNTHTEPSYKDIDALLRFVTPRGKMLGKDKSGLTAKNQRKVAKQLKYARYLGLIAYTAYQEERVHRAHNQAE